MTVEMEATVEVVNLHHQEMHVHFLCHTGSC